MLPRSTALVAPWILVGGCRGTTTLAVAVLIAIIIAASLRNGISLSRIKCPHCGRAGGTQHFDEKDHVDYVTCDHCGKQM
jgi:hypothetical protein